MTIIVNGSLRLHADRREAALGGCFDLVVGARSQPGCLAYVWSADPHEADVVWVYERWESEGAFASHLSGPWYPGMLAHLGGHGLASADILKHRVDRSEPIYDESRTPRADFFTSE